MSRILVIEDESAVRVTLRALLEDEGYEVSTAPDGVAAFAKLASFPADLVIADVRMPRMDGRALYDAMRELPGLHPKVIFMSANDRDESDSTPFISKPIAFEQLIALMNA